MSDAPRGPGWWQAADGKWYPPTATPTPPVAAPTPPIPPPIGPIPSGPPPSGGSGRKGLIVALGVLGVIAVGALVVTMGKDDDGGGTASTTQRPEETEETTPPTTEAPEANPVVVVEQGFSNYANDDGPKAGYGFVIQNNGQDIVRSIDMVVRFYGAADDEALWKAGHTVDMLRPGEKIGYGDELSGELEGVAVERMEVEIPFIPKAVEDPSTIPDGGFQVGNVKTEASALFLHTTFTISTTYSTDVIFPMASAIYRNAAGQIVGGASTTGLITPDGTLLPDAKIETWSIFPGVTATEVYVDSGLLIP